MAFCSNQKKSGLFQEKQTEWFVFLITPSETKYSMGTQTLLFTAFTIPEESGI